MGMISWMIRINIGPMQVALLFTIFIYFIIIMFSNLNLSRNKRTTVEISVVILSWLSSV